MGRPNTCQTCCTDLPDDPRPASECETLICVALIDENDKGRTTFEAKMIKWIEAYPNRLLFVMDVTGGNMYYPSSFIAYDKAFSYFRKTGNKVIRDQGETPYSDVWAQITSMVNASSTAIQNLFSAAKEVSIFTDNSGSMTAPQVSGAVALLKTEIVADGKRVVGSITNKSEDVICPFVLEQCCTSEAASDLRVLCGLDACSPTTLLWGLQPNGAFVVDDPCPANSTEACESCPDLKYADHTVIYRAYVKTADGQILDYPTINYTIQARNSSDDDWQDIYGLPDGLSNAEQSFDTLLESWGGGGYAWQKVGDDIDGEAAFDSHGYSVSLSSDGNVVAIGSPQLSSQGDNDGVGYVRVYDWSGSAWVQRGNDIEGEADDDRSGYSVSLSSDGSVVAIGAPFNNVSGVTITGHVRVYAWSGSAWVQRGNDIDGEVIGDFSGESVSLSGDGNIVAIGAYLHKPGQVEVYTWRETSWVQLGSDLAGGGEFGRSVSLINNKENNVTTIAIGAHDYTRGFDDDAGRVTVFRFLKLSTCHPLISQYGSPVSSCEEYTDVPIGNNCSRRVFKREFRIKAKTEGLDAIYSSVFKLYKYIYQKANLSGKWVPAGRSEQYIHRSWWETDNNNIKMSNGSQWGTIQRAGTHRHVQGQVAGGAETNKGISDMLLVGENGNRYARTDNPPLAFHDQCNQTPEDHCDLPANRYSDSHHHCGGLPLGPIDNSSNDSFSAFFLPSGSYLTARATLGFAGCTRGSARWNNDDEALRELLIGEPAKHHDAPDHWQRNPGGLDGITWDFENVICINPTLPSPSLPTSSLAIRYSTEKPHIIALAAKRDLFGTPGFPATDPTGGGLPFAAMVNFYQLRPVDSNQNDNWMTIQPWFEWVLSD